MFASTLLFKACLLLLNLHHGNSEIIELSRITSKDNNLFLEDGFLDIASAVKNKVIRKRQFERGNSDTDRGFSNSFDEIPRRNSINDFPRRDFPPRPNGNRRPVNNQFDGDSSFVWSSTSDSPRTRPPLVSPTATTTRRTASEQQSTTNRPGVPIENDCTRRCFSTPGAYNPVCGTDNITYNNPTRLQCARSCGISVEVASYSTCRPAPNRVFPSRTR